MRIVPFSCMLMFVAAIASEPATTHSLVARRSYDGTSFYLEGSNAFPYSYVDESDTTQETNSRIHLSAQEIERYVRSQIVWSEEESTQAEFQIGKEHLAQSENGFLTVVEVGLIQRQNKSHGDCSQALVVLVSLKGEPVGISANKLATCLV